MAQKISEILEVTLILLHLIENLLDLVNLNMLRLIDLSLALCFVAKLDRLIVLELGSVWVRPLRFNDFY